MDRNSTDNNDDKLATAALVCGLVSIFIFPLAFGAAAIIFGLIVQDRVEDQEVKAYQTARLGIIFGVIGIVFWIVSLFALNYIGIDMNSLMGTQEPQSAF